MAIAEVTPIKTRLAQRVLLATAVPVKGSVVQPLATAERVVTIRSGLVPPLSTVNQLVRMGFAVRPIKRM